MSRLILLIIRQRWIAFLENTCIKMDDLAKDNVDSFYYSPIAGFSNNFLRTSSCLYVDTFVAYHSTSADVARCFFWMSWQVGLLTGNPRESESDRQNQTAPYGTVNSIPHCLLLGFPCQLFILCMCRDMWFPTMWHFDKCRLIRACAASF